MNEIDELLLTDVSTLGPAEAEVFARRITEVTSRSGITGVDSQKLTELLVEATRISLSEEETFNYREDVRRRIADARESGDEALANELRLAMVEADEEADADQRRAQQAADAVDESILADKRQALARWSDRKDQAIRTRTADILAYAEVGYSYEKARSQAEREVEPVFERLRP